MPVHWPFNVDLFGFVTGKRIDLPVEAADAPPVVAQSALTNSSTSVRCGTVRVQPDRWATPSVAYSDGTEEPLPPRPSLHTPLHRMRGTGRTRADSQDTDTENSGP